MNDVTQSDRLSTWLQFGKRQHERRVVDYGYKVMHSNLPQYLLRARVFHPSLPARKDLMYFNYDTIDRLLASCSLRNGNITGGQHERKTAIC